MPPALLSSHLLQGHGSLVQPVSMPWLQSGKVSSLPCVPTHDRMCLHKAGRAWAQQVHTGDVFGPLGYGGPVTRGDHPGASPQCFLTPPRHLLALRRLSMLTTGHQPGAAATGVRFL